MVVAAEVIGVMAAKVTVVVKTCGDYDQQGNETWAVPEACRPLE